MNGGSRIIDLHVKNTASAEDDLLLLDDDVEMAGLYAESGEDAAPSRGGWILPALALVASAAWLGAMLWLSRATLPDLAPVALTEFIAALCVPVALIAVLLLLVTRSSKAEARRFGDVARAMRIEAASLERSVAALAQSIDTNRARLADQTNALMAMGANASATLASLGIDMADQIVIAGTHATNLTEAANGAHARLGILLALLPKAQGEANGMAERLEAAGVSASEHTAALHAQLTALAERGREADSVSNDAAQKLAAHISRMEATSETAGARLEAVTGEMSAAVDGLLGRTASAVDEARKGITAQGEAMLAMLGANQAALDITTRESADALAGRITSIEALVDRIATRLGEQREAGDAMIDALGGGIGDVSAKLDALHAQGVERSQLLAASISALGGSADAMTEALKTGDAMATNAIGTTERLLTALDSAAREIDETLPDALARLDARIANSRKVVVEAKPELLALVTAAESTHDAIEAIAQVIAAQRDTADKLSGTLLATLDSSREKADALGIMVDETIGRTHRFAEESAPRLVEALLRVRDTASAAADRARETLAKVIPETAVVLEQESAAAMRRATENAVESHVAAIGEAAEAAAEAAGRASERLTRQMLTIADATAIVESRITEAREEREKADHDSFARRVSLLIESLNSASIDITKSFSTEVSDSAWAAYLKGDRGVFTRRAVRLLETGEAREIARLYDDDGEFREQVNRYIHDFEAMLRAILAQRDGSPLGVTLLSSDMGKLYVALAQAIERLRS